MGSRSLGRVFEDAPCPRPFLFFLLLFGYHKARWLSCVRVFLLLPRCKVIQGLCEDGNQGERLGCRDVQLLLEAVFFTGLETLDGMVWLYNWPQHSARGVTRR